MTRYSTKQNAAALREWMWLTATNASELSQALDICESTIHLIKAAKIAPTLETAIALDKLTRGYVSIRDWQDMIYKEKMRLRIEPLANRKLTPAQKEARRSRFQLTKPKNVGN